MDQKYPKRPRDPNQLAKAIIDIATGQAPITPPDDKDPAAVQRGRLGGLKGGKARAEKMNSGGAPGVSSNRCQGALVENVAYFGGHMTASAVASLAAVPASSPFASSFSFLKLRLGYHSLSPQVSAFHLHDIADAYPLDG